jgi:hypothetical protein
MIFFYIYWVKISQKKVLAIFIPSFLRNPNSLDLINTKRYYYKETVCDEIQYVTIPICMTQ